MRLPILLLTALTWCLASRDAQGKPIGKDDTLIAMVTQALGGTDKDKAEAISIVLDLLAAIDLPTLCTSITDNSSPFTRLDDVIANAAQAYGVTAPPPTPADLSRTEEHGSKLEAEEPEKDLTKRFPLKNAVSSEEIQTPYHIPTNNAQPNHQPVMNGNNDNDKINNIMFEIPYKTQNTEQPHEVSHSSSSSIITNAYNNNNKVIQTPYRTQDIHQKYFFQPHLDDTYINTNDNNNNNKSPYDQYLTKIHPLPQEYPEDYYNFILPRNNNYDFLDINDDIVYDVAAAAAAAAEAGVTSLSSLGSGMSLEEEENGRKLEPLSADASAVFFPDGLLAFSSLAAAAADDKKDDVGKDLDDVIIIKGSQSLKPESSPLLAESRRIIAAGAKDVAGGGEEKSEADVIDVTSPATLDPTNDDVTVATSVNVSNWNNVTRNEPEVSSFPTVTTIEDDLSDENDVTSSLSLLPLPEELQVMEDARENELGTRIQAVIPDLSSSPSVHEGNAASDIEQVKTSQRVDSMSSQHETLVVSETTNSAADKNDSATDPTTTQAAPTTSSSSSAATITTSTTTTTTTTPTTSMKTITQTETSTAKASSTNLSAEKGDFARQNKPASNSTQESANKEDSSQTDWEMTNATSSLTGADASLNNTTANSTSQSPPLTAQEVKGNFSSGRIKAELYNSLKIETLNAESETTPEDQVTSQNLTLHLMNNDKTAVTTNRTAVTNYIFPAYGNETDANVTTDAGLTNSAPANNADLTDSTATTDAGFTNSTATTDAGLTNSATFSATLTKNSAVLSDTGKSGEHSADVSANAISSSLNESTTPTLVDEAESRLMTTSDNGPLSNETVPERTMATGEVQFTTRSPVNASSAPEAVEISETFVLGGESDVTISAQNVTNVKSSSSNDTQYNDKEAEVVTNVVKDNDTVPNTFLSLSSVPSLASSTSRTLNVTVAKTDQNTTMNSNNNISNVTNGARSVTFTNASTEEARTTTATSPTSGTTESLHSSYATTSSPITTTTATTTTTTSGTTTHHQTTTDLEKQSSTSSQLSDATTTSAELSFEPQLKWWKPYLSHHASKGTEKAEEEETQKEEREIVTEKQQGEAVEDNVNSSAFARWAGKEVRDSWSGADDASNVKVNSLAASTSQRSEGRDALFSGVALNRRVYHRTDNNRQRPVFQSSSYKIHDDREGHYHGSLRKEKYLSNNVKYTVNNNDNPRFNVNHEDQEHTTASPPDLASSTARLAGEIVNSQDGGERRGDDNLEASRAAGTVSASSRSQPNKPRFPASSLQSWSPFQPLYNHPIPNPHAHTHQAGVVSPNLGTLWGIQPHPTGSAVPGFDPKFPPYRQQHGLSQTAPPGAKYVTPQHSSLSEPLTRRRGSQGEGKEGRSQGRDEVSYKEVKDGGVGGISRAEVSRRVLELLGVRQKTLWSEDARHLTAAAAGASQKGYACPGLFGYFGDIMDCKSFFICSWGVPYRFYCPARTLWNPTQSVCDWERNVDCANPQQP